jgi:hypothetical protein
LLGDIIAALTNLQRKGQHKAFHEASIDTNRDSNMGGLDVAPALWRWESVAAARTDEAGGEYTTTD